jgi:hypothetical protein
MGVWNRIGCGRLSMFPPWVIAIDPGDLDREAVESRSRQGLPSHVEDPATIARVVRSSWPAAHRQIRQITSMRERSKTLGP